MTAVIPAKAQDYTKQCPSPEREMTVVIPAKAQDYTKHRQRMPLTKTGNDGCYPSQSAGLQQASPAHAHRQDGK
ncbi:hypothetical protein [Aeromonas dhakensis]|uniref:hypothetical protein n=1 Tax=Aeromonas dhakensis TaxID=196024 RepID=UPI001C5A7D14|nr:hypothetical protein [Aeromonas dhakensis]MBW3690577.1 hypothetical protein [Aeromonas dhakensis]